MCRRKVFGLALVAALTSALLGEAQVVRKGTDDKAPVLRVSLLGTGGPPPRINHFGASTLVEAGGKKLLFDCGRGTAIRLSQLFDFDRVRLADVDALFLTHLHYDHTVGIADLWLSGWAMAGRKVPFRVWGPAGTEAMMSHLERAYAFDVRLRRDGIGVPDQGAQVLAKDIDAGVAYEKDGVKVTAFSVDHGPVKLAFGFRVDFAGRSVVISGDTRVSENLIRHSQGVDLLIHEAFPVNALRARGPEYFGSKQWAAILQHHTMPEQAGEVFSRVKPKLAVISHYADDQTPSADLAREMITSARKSYSGPLEVGSDLMVIEVGDTVQVRRMEE